MPRYIDAEQMEKHIMESKVFNQYFKELVQSLIWGENTVDAVPVVRGRWRTWEEQFPDRTTRKKNNLGVFCSACQLHADNMTSYCPNCGAKMEVEHEN